MTHTPLAAMRKTHALKSNSHSQARNRQNGRISRFNAYGAALSKEQSTEAHTQ